MCRNGKKRMSTVEICIELIFPARDSLLNCTAFEKIVGFRISDLLKYGFLQEPRFFISLNKNAPSYRILKDDIFSNVTFLQLTLANPKQQLPVNQQVQL